MKCPCGASTSTYCELLREETHDFICEPIVLRKGKGCVDSGENERICDRGKSTD